MIPSREILVAGQPFQPWFEVEDVHVQLRKVFSRRGAFMVADAPGIFTSKGRLAKETARAREYEFVTMSCPSLAKDTLVASTLSPLTKFDTVLSLRQGNQAALGGGLCNDDHGIESLGWLTFSNKTQSVLGLASGAMRGLVGDSKQYPVIVSSGAGVRVILVDGFYSWSEGPFSLFLRAPPPVATPGEPSL